jgi:hypothetical protein
MVRVIQGFFAEGRPPQPEHLHRSGALSPMHGRAAGHPPAIQPRLAATDPAAAHGFEIDPIRLGLVRAGGQQLPQAVLAKMEAAFGADFSAVRVHQGPQAARIGALAFTTGNDIYFAPGRYQPDTMQGQQLLGHELAHVVQQRQGRVRAGGAGVSVVHDRMLEAEADRLGMRAAAFQVGPAGARPAAVGPLPRPGWQPEEASTAQLKKHWTAAQHEQSRKFWEKKHARMARQQDAARARHVREVAEILSRQRIHLTDLIPEDEEYFQAYLRSRPTTPINVYRGDGRGVTADSLDNLVGVTGITPVGALDLTFKGIAEHTHSNTMPGGVISTAGNKDCAIHFAVDKHKYGLVYTMQVTNYIDVNTVLRARNFKVRFEAQQEYIIPCQITAANIIRVELYEKDPSRSTDLWTGGRRLASRSVTGGVLQPVVPG